MINKQDKHKLALSELSSAYGDKYSYYAAEMWSSANADPLADLYDVWVKFGKFNRVLIHREGCRCLNDFMITIGTLQHHSFLILSSEDAILPTNVINHHLRNEEYDPVVFQTHGDEAHRDNAYIFLDETLIAILRAI